mgnify:CR=1 FL=1
MTKNYRLIAIRRFCSRIACGRLSLLYAQSAVPIPNIPSLEPVWCPGGCDWDENVTESDN